MSEQQRMLIELEKWGLIKYWSDVMFVHRLRNMRSQMVFDMQKSRLEKVMERQHHLKEGRQKEAKILYDYHMAPWEKMSIQ